MKKIFLIALFSLLCCETAFAGEWKTDENGTKYIQDDGTYATGWYQDINGAWYFLDLNTGYLLKNTTTPDGYPVNEVGVWVKEAQTTNDMISYEKVLDSNITKFGYSVPIKVYYNSSYAVASGGEILISKAEVAQDGAAYILLNQSNADGLVGVNQKYKLTMDDGTIKEGEKACIDFSWKIDNTSFKLLSDPLIDIAVRNSKIVSAEVWITEYIPEN